jgi:hypothetical protein
MFVLFCCFFKLYHTSISIIWSFLVVKFTNSEDYLTIFYFVLMTSMIIGQIELIIVQLTLDTALAVTSVVAVTSVFIFSSGAIFPWPGLQVRKLIRFKN